MRPSLCTGPGVLRHPITGLLVPGQTSPALRCGPVPTPLPLL